MTYLLILLFITAVLLILNQLRKPKFIYIKDNLKINYTFIAHRGASGEAPENTITSFRIAVEDYGAEVLEMDVHATKDNEIVVIHDDTIDRTVNGRGKVKDYTYEELKKFDAGYRFKNTENENYTCRGKGITIPTLKEVFEQFPNLKYNIEIKQKIPHIEKEVISLIREMNMTDKVIIGSSKVSVSKKIKKLAPDIVSFCNSGNVVLFYFMHILGLGFLYRPRYEAIQTTPYTKVFHIVQSSMIRAAHKKGMLFHVWTINDEKDMEKYIKLGVDGIMTDYPGKLRSVLKKRSEERRVGKECRSRWSPYP